MKKPIALSEVGAPFNVQTAGAAPDVRIHFPVLDQDDIYIYIKRAKIKKK